LEGTVLFMEIICLGVGTFLSVFYLVKRIITPPRRKFFEEIALICIYVALSYVVFRNINVENVICKWSLDYIDQIVKVGIYLMIFSGITNCFYFLSEPEPDYDDDDYYDDDDDDDDDDIL
jgi:hypothetical protein